MTFEELSEVAWLTSARREPFEPQLLRQRRKEARISASTLGAALGCRQREVERWESGDRARLSRVLLK